MFTTDRRSADYTTARSLRSRNAVVGVDGGGTKTSAVILNARDEIIGEGTAGPSNPIRVGVMKAAAAVREAVDKACGAARVRRTDLMALHAGLAGARRNSLRARLQEALSGIVSGEVTVVSDADIALYGATDGQPGVVVIAGTGSICCGINARGKRACAGGWGPLVGDEGGGSWIARRALSAIARAWDGRGPKTPLTDEACSYFHVTAPDDLATAIYAPTITNEWLAGFGKYVIEAAQARDRVAEQILTAAGYELGLSATAVIRNLKLERETFQVAYVGRVFSAAGELVLAPMRLEINKIARKAFLAPPRYTPAVAAARMAREHLNHVALAV